MAPLTTAISSGNLSWLVSVGGAVLEAWGDPSWRVGAELNLHRGLLPRVTPSAALLLPPQKGHLPGPRPPFWGGQEAVGSSLSFDGWGRGGLGERLAGRMCLALGWGWGAPGRGDAPGSRAALGNIGQQRKGVRLALVGGI